MKSFANIQTLVNAELDRQKGLDTSQDQNIMDQKM